MQGGTSGRGHCGDVGREQVGVASKWWCGCGGQSLFLALQSGVQGCNTMILVITRGVWLGLVIVERKNGDLTKWAGGNRGHDW